MNKATPIPGSVKIIANGSLENGSCECGRRITRAVNSRPLPWWHIETGRTTCPEKSAT